MKHIKKYNEESIWNAFKVGKSRLYDKSRNLKKRSPNTQPYRFYSLKLPSIKLIDEYLMITPPREKGTFLMHGRGDNLSFRERVYDDEIWFDAKPIFDRLHKIGDSLGYKLGSAVSCNSLNTDTKIVEIVDFAFYEKGHSFPSIDDSIYPVFTLLYRLEGDDDLHQVNDIDLIASKSVDNIVDETIKENFYDLLDDDTVEYFSNKKSYRGSVLYECSLKLKKLLTPDILFKVSEMLLIAEKRLKDQGITLLIKKFNTQDEQGVPITSINFICHNGKNIEK